jgi:CubicO group peptidase (beta-lactamase class C family)
MSKLLAVFFAAMAANISAATAQTCSFAAVETRFTQLLSDAQLPGGAILIGSASGIYLERYFGSYSASTRIPIASASKLLSGVRLMQLADRAQLNLDAPLAGYLPQFTGLKGTMTVRQMFSHTSGYGDDSGDPIVFDRSITLAQAVDTIATSYPLQNGWTPGAQFAYGGVSMQIAGRIAELRGNSDWQNGWLSQTGTPLGITTINWQAFGATQNYGIAGSAQSNLRDYGRLLQMLANQGVGNGRRILSASAVTELTRDNVGSLPIAYAPPGATVANMPIKYGFGGWLQPSVNAPLGAPPLMHSLGAFGYFPWVDFRRNIFGVFMIRGAPGINGLALPAYLDMLTALETAIATDNCPVSERTDPILTDAFEG